MAVSQTHDDREAPPVDVGATFEIIVGGGPNMWRCTNIWIDEDGVPHVTLETLLGRERPPAKVSYEDLREKLLDGYAERCNSGHQAWQWRQDR